MLSDYLAPSLYWLLTGVWAYLALLCFGWWRRLRGSAHAAPVLVPLLALGLDAARTVAESVWFGTAQAARLGFLPRPLFEQLYQPGWLLLPKLLTLAAALAILYLLRRRWEPAWAHARRRHAEARRRRHGEASFRTLVECASDAIVRIDAREGVILDCNAQAERLTGYRRDQLAGRHYSELHPPAERAACARMYALAGSGERTTFGDVMVVHRSGERIPVEIAAAAYDDGGQRVLVGVCRDLRERRRAAAALKAERDRAEAYLDVAGVMLLGLDRGGRVTLLNRRGSEILGWEPAALVGEDWFAHCVPAEQRAAVRALFDQLTGGAAEAVPERHENAVLTRSGERRLIAWRNHPLPAADGGVTAVLCSGEDVTEQRRAEQALRRSEERLRLVVQNHPDGIWDWHVDSNQLFLSERLSAMTGYHEENMGDNPFAFVIDHIHPEDRDRALEVLRAHFEEQAPLRTELRLRVHGGEARWFRVQGQALWDAQGRPQRLAGSLTAICDRCRPGVAFTAAALGRLAGELDGARYHCDGAGHLVWRAARGGALGGLEPGPPAGGRHPLADRVVAADRARLERAWTRARREGTPLALGYRVQLADGSTRRVLELASPVAGCSGCRPRHAARDCLDGVIVALAEPTPALPAPGSAAQGR